MRYYSKRAHTVIRIGYGRATMHTRRIDCPWAFTPKCPYPWSHRHYLRDGYPWHTFHGLAQAARVMARGPLRDQTNEPLKGPPSALRHHACKRCASHLETQPTALTTLTIHTVMSGYKAEESLSKSYPVVKPADFDLPVLTARDDARNPMWFE